MSYGINAYRPTGYDQYARATESQSTPSTARAQAAATPQSTASLSTDEEQMIRKFFPGSEALSLKLYGPERGTRSLNPHTLGSRLDLQG